MKRHVLILPAAVILALHCALLVLPAQQRPASDTASILISGRRESTVTTRPQRELPGYRWLLGLYGMGTLQQHNARFNFLNGMFLPSAVPLDSSFGNASVLGGGLGFVMDHRLSPLFKVQLRLGASYSTPEFTLQHNQGTDSNRNLVYYVHTLKTSLLTVNLAPSVGVRLVDQLFLSVGVDAQYLVRATYDYSDSLFPASARPGSSFLSQSNSGSIQSSLAFAAFAGLEWYIPLSRSAFLTPFVRYQFPLTSIAETSVGGQISQVGDPPRIVTTPLSSGSWTVGALQAGIALQWGEGSVNPIIRETVYERDTSSAIVEGGQERLRLRSSESGLVTSEENGLVVERTIIHESYVREVPKQSALKADVRVTGVDWDGSRQPNPTVVVEEFESETFHPLLPHIFFPISGSELTQTRQVILGSPKAADAWREDALPNNALAVHAHLLNIIGSRLKANPQARLSVLGCTSNIGGEKDNTELAMKRAKAVQTYLATVWRIKADRIRIQGRTLPEKASSNEVAEGVAENRRVEISASTPEILAPVVNRAITRTLTPPSLELQPVIDAPAGLRSWTLAIKRKGSILQQWTGESVTSETPPPQQWRLSEQLLGESEIPLTASIQVTDIEGREASAESPVTVRQITVKKKRVDQVKDKRLERFSLMLFDFDRAEISADNLTLLSFIKQRIAPTSQLTIIGYGDRVGSREYNRDLAFRRSVEVKNFLQLPEDRIKIVPIGNDVLLHDNATPEGRSYCRVVQVIIATPMEK